MTDKPRLCWIRDHAYEFDYVDLPQCMVSLEKRRPGCDRGNFYAKVYPKPGYEFKIYIDGADGFPRYYFDETRAKLELEAWLSRRGLA
jgi:hypothetical protein